MTRRALTYRFQWDRRAFNLKVQMLFESGFTVIPFCVFFA